MKSLTTLKPEEIKIVEGAATERDMSTGDKTILKQVLRDECLPALGGQSKYYNAEAVNAWLQNAKGVKMQRKCKGGQESFLTEIVAME